MADSEQVKAALAALAAGETRESTVGAGTGTESTPCAGPTATERPGPQLEYRTVIERAVAATDDVAAAAEFVESVGLDRLESAVQAAEHEVSGLAEDGREALATFERFRIAAEGPVE